MTVAKDFAIPIITGIIVAALTPVVLAVVSQVMSGNWLQWLEGLETIHYIIIVVMIGGFIATVVFIYTRKPPVGSGWSDATSDSSYHPYRLLPDKRYNDVLWEVYGSREVPVLNETVKIKTPPKCFKCQVELKEESRRFIGGYKWWCIRCGFSKKNKGSFEEEADCVKRLVEGEYRRQRQGQPPQGHH